MLRDYFFAILFSVFLIPSYTCAQSAVDSLREVLKTARGAQRAEFLIELSGHTRQTDVKKAINQVNEALRIAQRMGEDKLEAKTLLKLGFYHLIQNNDAKTLEYYLNALDITRQNEYGTTEASVLHQLGRFYDGQENYSKALEYYFKALRASEAAGDREGLAPTLYYIGIVYEKRNEIDNAGAFYKQAYNRARELKNYRQISIAASGMAMLFQKQDSLDKALFYYDRAMEAAEAINSSHAKATILLHMSSAYQDQKLFEQALELNNQQIKIARSTDSRFLEAQGLQNLADLYFDQENLERSSQYYRQAKSVYGKIGYTENSVIATNSLADVFLAQGQLAEAIETGKEALGEARALGSFEQMKTALETLVRAYVTGKDFQNALQAQTRLAAVNDSIFDKVREKQIADMQTRYETERKEQEIALLRQEQGKAELFRNALIGGLILMVLIGILVYNRQRLKIHKNQMELENIHLKEQQLEKDLAFKNKQLTTHSLHLVQKNEAMKELKKYIGKIKLNQDGETTKGLQGLKNLVDYSFSLDEDWQQFQLHFEEVHTGFFAVLKDRYPDLTINELRLSALVKLNLTSKEIAAIMRITPGSVKTARYRLRKKLGMETEENLTEFMMDIEKQASGRAEEQA